MTRLLVLGVAALAGVAAMVAWGCVRAMQEQYDGDRAGDSAANTPRREDGNVWPESPAGGGYA